MMTRRPRRVKTPPKWIKDGARVLFESVRGRPDYTYSGVVDGEPFQLGGGDWCVRLREMDPRYRNGTRSTEPAACVEFLRPAE